MNLFKDAVQVSSKIVVDQSKSSDSAIHNITRLIALSMFSTFLMVLAAGMFYSAVNGVLTSEPGDLVKAGFLLLLLILWLGMLAFRGGSLLVNPYPKLWLYQEGLVLFHRNKQLLLEWGSLSAARERSHDWKFWRRDKLTIYCDQLPEPFGRFERFQNGVRKIYLMGDAANFDRLDKELRERAVVKEMK
jgi:hypothetical protein